MTTFRSYWAFLPLLALALMLSFGNAQAQATTTATSTATTTATSTTDMSTTTPDLSTTTLAALQDQIDVLQSIVTWLEDRVQELLRIVGQGGAGSGGGASTTTPSIQGSPRVTPSGATYAPGATINFSGRNFTREQDIHVTLNGALIARAHADGGGNFTTGSLLLPFNEGTYTYVFTGARGDNVTSTITVQQ